MNTERTDLSPNAKIIWDTLTDEEKKIIDKYYPIPTDREALFRKLRRKKIKFKYIAEISRSCITTVKEHATLKPAKVTKYDLKKLLVGLKEQVAHLKEIIQSI